MHKFCHDCKQEKPLSEFYIRKTRKTLQGTSKCKSCHREYYRQKTIKRKIQVIELYGGKCECCGESNIEFLSIDHKNKDGNLERKKIFGRDFYNSLVSLGHRRDDLRLLCMNCNFSLGKFGYCPHEK